MDFGISAPARPAPKRAVVITGPSRAGKTYLSTRLAETYGARAVHIDRFRRHFWNIVDLDERNLERRRRYCDLIRHSASGLVLEGEDLIFRNRGHDGLVRSGRLVEDATVCLGHLEHIMRETGAPAFLVGCADAQPEEKAAFVRHHQKPGDWTNRLSDEQLLRHGRRCVQLSLMLRDMTAGTGITYLEIGTHTFDRCVAAAVQRLGCILTDRPAAPSRIV